MNAQNDFMKNLLSRGGVTHEIKTLAMKKFLSDSRVRKEEVDILKVRITIKEKEIRKQKLIWRTHSEEAEAPLGSHWLRKEYRDIKKWEMNRVWHSEKDKMMRKGIWLQHKNNTQYFEGITVGDKELSDRFGEQQDEGLVLDNIETNEAINAFLRLPPKFRIFSSLKEQEHRIQAETTAAKQRWSKKEDGEGQISFDTRRDNRERKELARKPQQGDNVSFTRLRPTDFISNKRVTHPPTLEESDEITVENQKNLIITAYKSHADKHKEGIESNLTELEQQGLKEIKEGIKSKDWMVYNTDKSSRIVLDTRENFLRAQLKHAEKDTIVSMEDLAAAEDELYLYSKAFTRIFNFGRDAGENKMSSIMESFKVSGGGAPANTGLRKDHKTGWDQHIGPPTRPVVNAKQGPNVNLGNAITRVVRPLREEWNNNHNTEVVSTEELLRSFQDYNHNRMDILQVRSQSGSRESFSRVCKQMQGDNIIIGSLDVKSLYPSCKAKSTGEHIKNFFKQSKLKYEAINKKSYYY